MGLWHQVGLEFGQINIQGSIKAEGSSDGGHNLAYQPVQVSVGWVLNIKVSGTDVIDGLIVSHEGTIRVLQGSGVVRMELWSSAVAMESWRAG